MSDVTPPPAEESDPGAGHEREPSIPAPFAPEPLSSATPEDAVLPAPSEAVTVPVSGEDVVDPATTSGIPPSNGMGNAALILGILGVLPCLFFVGGILAIVFGRIGINKAKRGEATNGSVAKVGFWLGIASVVLWILVGIGVGIGGVFFVGSINDKVSVETNSQTGLADGQYQLDPTSSFVLNDRCAFAGVPYDATLAKIPPAVTVSGQGIVQCGTDSTEVKAVRFDVTNGVASILMVR